MHSHFKRIKTKRIRLRLLKKDQPTQKTKRRRDHSFQGEQIEYAHTYRRKKKPINGFVDPSLEVEIKSNMLKSEYVKENAKEKRDNKQVGRDTNLDTEVQDMFEVAEVGHGDESMAC